MNFTHALAVVTGGASGLGRAVAERIVAAGGRAAILDLQEEAGLRVAKDIGARFIKCDVSSESQVDAAMAAARQAMNGINLLVNCAGVIGVGKMLGKDGPMAGEYFSTVIRINLLGTFLCDKAAAALMRDNAPNAEGERGVLIHTASVAAYDGQIGQAAYSASKGGIVAMTLPIARELAQFGIRVLTIAPGLFMTPLLGSLPQEAQDSLAAAIPFPRRLGQADEFASLALHMIDNPYLNGEVVRLDASLRMAPK